jgi:gas vesicle protein
MSDKGKSVGKSLAEMFTLISVSVLSGFILGLLFAPQSGLKTRKKLAEKIKDVVDRGKFALIEAKVFSEELLEKGKEKVEKVSSKIKGKSESDID